MHARMTRARSTVWLVLAWLGVAAGARAAEPERLVDIGTSVAWDGAASVAPEGDSGPVRVVVRWDAIERDPGQPDWSSLGDTVDSMTRSGSPVVLALEPAHPVYLPAGGVPSPVEPQALDAWLAFVRGTVRALSGRIQAIEIGGALVPGVTADAYAFLLKASAVAIRAEVSNAPRIVQTALPVGDVERARELWDRDVAAYVDVVAVRVGPTGDTEALRSFVAENIAHPPAATVWAYVERAPASAWDAPAGALRALAAGAHVALVDVRADEPATPDVLRWIGLAHRTLAPGFASAPIGAVQFEGPNGEARQDAEALAAFVFSDGSATIVWLRAPPDGGATGDRIVLDTAFANNVRWLDPSTGEEQRVGSRPAASGRGRSVPIVRGVVPAAVLYDRPTGTAGFDLGPQEVETSGTRELTAEEIVARYQEVQRTEDDRLERWIADARIDYHAKFAQGGSTVDVSIDARYFWERGAELEWEETGYRVNGNRVRWDKFPEIPLIQPEKVFTLPLDLTLDRTYRYRRVGREAIDGRDAYVLEFSPTDHAPGTSLYHGRVWIDAQGFWRVKIALLQTGLESPVLSNEEVDHYAARLDPSGTTFRLLERTNGQQNWSVGGRTVVVRREVTFARYDVNPAPAEFEAQRRAAYASDHKMVRDTPDGIRYLARNADGSRSVKPVDSNQWFAAAGAFRDASSDGVVPFAGANYFDYDLAGKDIQINALLGGVLYLVTASKPDIGHGTSATVDAFASAIHFSDQVFVGQEGLDTETVDERPQRLGLHFGFPLRPYLRLNLGLGLAFRQYDDNEDSNAALAAYNVAHPGQNVRFVLPEDHRTLGPEVELEFNRKGWTIRADASWDERSDWAAFGPFDDTSATFVRFDPQTATYVPSAPEPVEERFALYSATVFREWLLPAFQKLRVEGHWLDGSRQDRFSSYQFSLFGEDRLNGFAGTGVRFDRGWIGRGGWSFNLFEAIRFDAVVETAGVRERGAPDRSSSFTGAGLSATVLGPWKTVLNLSYGRALDSEIPDLEGADEFFFLVLKLF
jgi:hypothetical protein